MVPACILYLPPPSRELRCSPNVHFGSNRDRKRRFLSRHREENRPSPWNQECLPREDPRHRPGVEPKNQSRGENNSPEGSGVYHQTLERKSAASKLLEPFGPWQGKERV